MNTTSTKQIDLTLLVPFSLEKGMDVIKEGGCLYVGPDGSTAVLPPQKFVSPHWEGKVVKNRIMLLPKSAAAFWQHRNYYVQKWIKQSEAASKTASPLSEKTINKLYKCNLPDKHQLAEKAVIALMDKAFVIACHNFATHYDRKDLKEWQSRWFVQTNDLIKEFGLPPNKLTNLLLIVDHCSK